MKKIILLLLFITSITFSQSNKSIKLNQVTIDELKMTIYDKDSTAVAVVLYEQGNSYMNPSKDYNLSTDYYYRIKILKKEGFDKGIIKIPYYKKESVTNLKAITYNIVANRIVKKHLLENGIFKNKETENWNSKTFTFPNIKIGSVLEYRYTLTTPYFNKLNDWNFQSNIPKIKSEYESAIISNYKYNVSLKGYQNLSKNNPSIKKRCIKIPGLSEASCNILSFGMENIPAFEEEAYITSPKNYMSRITFELESFTEVNGSKTRYTDTWKSTDRKFKSGDYFGAELRKTSFFKKNIPTEILELGNNLERAQKIYYFIQDHYTNNGANFSYHKIESKKSFQEKSGNIADINIALYNALKAGNIDANIALLATRDRGFPTKLYPVITDFNYIIVLINVDGKEYFLDATNKNLSFGITPFYTLNGEIRVMDFKKGSYWKKLTPFQKSSENINLLVNVSSDGELAGKLRIKNTGYYAYNLRNKIKGVAEESYIESYESDNEVEINSYKAQGLDRKQAMTIQSFDFSFENSGDAIGNKIYINPFFHEKMQINPFKLKERLYPVNFGYNHNYNYRANITIPKNYKITDLPKSKAFTLPNNGGRFVFNIKNLNSKVSILFKFKLNKSEFSNEEYFALKELFNQMIKIQSSLIILEPSK